MDINDKKLKRTSKIINWTIAIVLAIFLILLSDLVIGDLDNTVSYPDQTVYVDKQALNKLEADNSQLQSQIDVLREVQSNYRKMQNASLDNKNNEQESFDNWIKTRNSIGRPDQDKEVLQRTRKIDELRTIAQQWGAKSDSVQEAIDSLKQQTDIVYSKISDLNQKANTQYDKAINDYDLQVFLIRLLFVAPILALGIFLFIRYRNHKFAAIFMGFSLFSVYAFFFGLVPYLPSYGGYIRYSIGILLTIGLGYYAIKSLRDYSEKKKAELKESTTERAKKLHNEISEKAFNNHICPSCGKDFLLKPWETPVQINKQTMQLASEYCRYCGLQLIKKCPKCEHANYAHLPYCIACGTDIR